MDNKVDDKVLKELYGIYERLRLNKSLIGEDQLDLWCIEFQKRFSPSALAQYDDAELLYVMHGTPYSSDEKRERDDLIHWLHGKRGIQFQSVAFGSLPLGTAGINAPYFHRNRQTWMARQGGTFTEVSEKIAIDIARQERDDLTLATQCLSEFPSNAGNEDYFDLQRRLDSIAPTFSNSPWGHKYLSLLFPDTLDFLHGTELQRFHLAKMLCPLTIHSGRVRYVLASWFRSAQLQTGIPRMQHLMTVLSERNGANLKSYSVLDVKSEGVPQWSSLFENGCIALDARAVSQGGVLCNISGGTMARWVGHGPPLSTWQRPDGEWSLQPHRHIDLPLDTGDVVIAVADNQVLGVGRVTGTLNLLGSGGYSIRVPVEWHLPKSGETWQVPHEDLLHSPGRRYGGDNRKRYYENILEIERHFVYDEIVFPPADASDLSKREFPRKQTISMVDANDKNINPNDTVDPALENMSSLPVLTGMVARAAGVLERKGQVIFFGPPGTGKSHWAERTAVEMAARSWFGKEWQRLSLVERETIIRPDGQGAIRTCCFHPAYGYEDFLEGYRPSPSTSPDGNLRFERRDGVFKRLCADAAADPGCDYFLLIEEINRGDVPRIFGELLAIMEKGKRGKSVLLPLSGEPFCIPKNIFVIGTMNTTDRSIALLDAALRRRFGFIELLPDPSLLAAKPIQGLSLAVWLETLNKRIVKQFGSDGRHLQVGHAYFLDVVGTPVSDLTSLGRVLRDDVIPLLEEYCYEDPSLLSVLLGRNLVDEVWGRLRDELFAPEREDDLLRALLNDFTMVTVDAGDESDGEIERINSDDVETEE